MAAVEIDSSQFPLVVTTMRDRTSDADIADMLATYDGLLQRREPYVGLLLFGEITRPPGPSQRAAIADWSRARNDLLVQYSLGYAIVVSNMLVRGALTALWWLHKPPSPEVFVPDEAAGLAWCAKQIDAAGMARPPRLRVA